MGWLPKPPDPNPGLIASAQASERVAQEQIQLAREQLNYSRFRDEEDRKLLMPVIQQQQRIADAQEERSKDYYDYEKNTFRPLEQRIIKEATEFNTDAERERQAGMATADVAQAFGNARDTTARTLARYGIARDPTQMAAAQQELDMQEALAKAGASNKARFAAKQMGQAMMMDAAGLGRGLATNATAAAQTAVGAGDSASRNTLGATASAQQGRDSARGWFAGGQNSLNSAMQGYGADYNARMGGYNARMGMIGDIIGAGARIAGGRADGGSMDEPIPGEVAGPGGPRDDLIHTRLSDGEYVIPEPVVRELGVQHFDKLILKHGSEQNKRALVERKVGLKMQGA